jgi:hypothetical protein
MPTANGHTDLASAITTSAAALEAELQRFMGLAATAVRIPLTSEKNLERAARATKDAAESEKRVLEHVSALGRAITVARETQQSSAAALNAHVEAIARRRTELDALLARFAALGEVVRAMNEAMHKITGYKESPYAPDTADDMHSAFDEMAASMTTAANHAQEVASEATAQDFDDLARQSEALRQQILALRNRLSLLQTRK